MLFRHRKRMVRVLGWALVVPCVIIGYQAGRSGVQRLCVATAHEDGLRYVGQLTRGFTASQAVDLEKRLAITQRSRPVTPCPHRSCGWPKWACKAGVSAMEKLDPSNSHVR